MNEHEQVRRLYVRLWEATTDALTFAWNTPLSEEQVTRIGVQPGRLLRVLERRGIAPIDETRLSVASHRREKNRQHRRRPTHHGQ